MFDSRNSSINCQFDNVVVYNENKTKVLDYCEKKNGKSFMGVKHISTALYVLYIYGSGFNFSVSFDWLALDLDNSDILSNSVSTTELITTTTTTTTTTAPVTTTLPKTTKQSTSLTSLFNSTKIVTTDETITEPHPITTILTISNKPIITVNSESTTTQIITSTLSESQEYNIKNSTNALTTEPTYTSTSIAPSLQSKKIPHKLKIKTNLNYENL
jgi:hypothetical protein